MRIGLTLSKATKHQPEIYAKHRNNENIKKIMKYLAKNVIYK